MVKVKRYLLELEYDENEEDSVAEDEIETAINELMENYSMDEVIESNFRVSITEQE